MEEAQLLELAGNGTIGPETLVWHEGLTNWRPYREVQPRPVPPSAPPEIAGPRPNEAACSQCGRVFSTQEMISYGGTMVCAACKPVFMQKLAEGVSVSRAYGKRPLPVDAEALLAEVLARDYTIDLGSCISRGWNLVKTRFGLTVGGTALIMLCTWAAGAVPFIGPFISLLVQGPLLGGLNLFLLRVIRGEALGVGEAFEGLTKRFWPLCGNFLLMCLLIYAWFLPVLGMAIFYEASGAAKPGAFPGPLFWGVLALGLVGVVWLAICFIFALPLCADMQLGPWTALKTSFRVVSRHWLSVFVLVFVSGALNLLGVLACVIGLFVTLPIFYAATLYAYEDIFAPRS